MRDEARALELPPIGISVLRLPISMYGLLLSGSRFLRSLLFWGLAVLWPILIRAQFLWARCWCSGGAAYACYAVDNGPQGRAVAIVTGGNIQARLATADTAGAVLALPAGSEVKILSTRGEWVYAALPNNLNGWIAAKHRADPYPSLAAARTAENLRRLGVA